MARKINKLTLHLKLETGATGKAFGSITVKDIEDAIKKELPNAAVERHAIQLERPIKETCLHEVPIKLHSEVTATLKVEIKSASEAAPIAAPAPAAPEEKKAAPKASGKKKA